MLDDLFKPLKLDLQYFANKGDVEGDSEKGDEIDNSNIDIGIDIDDYLKDGMVQLKPEELKSLFDAESDKKVNKAIQTAKKNWEKEYERKLEREKREAERLAKMTKDEREQEKFKQKQKQLEERERELNRREMRAEAINILNENELPTDVVDFLVGEDAEETNDNINRFSKAFKKAVNEAVKERVRQETPSASVGKFKGVNPFDKETFNLTEQARIYKEDPEKYYEMKKQAKK